MFGCKTFRPFLHWVNINIKWLQRRCNVRHCFIVLLNSSTNYIIARDGQKVLDPPPNGIKIRQNTRPMTKTHCHPWLLLTREVEHRFCNQFRYLFKIMSHSYEQNDHGARMSCAHLPSCLTSGLTRLSYLVVSFNKSSRICLSVKLIYRLALNNR